MKQLDIFQECHPEKKETKPKGFQWKLFIDGASRKNPGISGAGVCLYKNDDPVVKKGFYLGDEKTNNQAEYLALILGIFLCKKYYAKDDELYIFSDSELLVRQVIGSYKIKNAHLKLLHDLAQRLLMDISFSICHVLRDANKDADEMANFGIDKKNPVPAEFINLLRAYDIPF